MKRHTTAKRVSLKEQGSPLWYTRHKQEITANSIPFLSMTLIVSRDSVNYGSEKIVAEVMSGCGFESTHSCYVRRLRVVLRNVRARYCVKHFLFPWVHFLQTRSDSGRWVVDFFLHTSIKMKFHWSGSTRPFQQESPWRIVEIKGNIYDFPVHVNSIEISAYFKNLLFTKNVNNNFKLF